jgi:hypothetical protein
MSAVLWLGAAIVLVTTPADAQTQAPERPPTFSKDIAPILQRSCQQCHRPNSIAPMSLRTYAEVRPWARAIKARTQLAYVPGARGVMPPWLLERNIGIQHIQDDISLSDAEIAAIARWADSGAPEGNPADLPPPLPLANLEIWTRGTPDLIVESPKFFVPGVGPDWWGSIGESPSVESLTEDRHAISVEYRENSKLTQSAGLLKSTASADTYAGQGKTSIWVVHHGGAAMRRPGEEDPVSGFPNNEVGHNGHVFPADAGRLVPAKAIFVWDGMHIHSPGVPGADREVTVSAGVRLHPRGYKPKYTEGRAEISSTELLINPNSASQRYDAYFVAPQPMKLLNFEPHMHAAGLRMCIEAIYDMSIETLNCAGYDHNWVRNYRYDENYAPLIPKGTILHTISWFDGTRKNANLADPRNTTVFGRRSIQNMLGLNNWVYYLTDEQYQEELAKRREFLTKTNGWDELIGCRDCWKSPLRANAAR